MKRSISVCSFALSTTSCIPCINFLLFCPRLMKKKKIKTISNLQKPAKGKTQTKKTSKFEKPKTAKKQTNKQINKKNQWGQDFDSEPSQVQKYNYRVEDLKESKIEFFGKSSINQGSPYANVQKKSDLSTLISKLAVGSSSHQNQDQPLSYQSRTQAHKRKQNLQSQQRSSVNQFGQKYVSPFINSPQNDERLHYLNQKSFFDKQTTNPYAKAPYEHFTNSFGINSFINPNIKNQPNQGILNKYTSQHFDPAKQSRFIKNNQTGPIYLLHQQSLPQFYNTPYQNNCNQLETAFMRMPSQKSISQVKNHPFQKHSQLNQLYPSQSSYTQQINPQFGDEEHQKYLQYSNLNVKKSRVNQNQDTLFKSPVSKSNRNLSPLTNSNSCRNFFVLQPRQVLQDNKNGTSRSKSRRKQKPGGSKSFYQPQLSARKIVSKQKQSQRFQQNYQRLRQFNDDQYIEQSNSESNYYQAPYFRQQQQQRMIQNQQRQNNGKNQTRMTRQTEFSGLSGWQPRSNIQKTTKSHQIYEPRQLLKEQKKSSQGFREKQIEEVRRKKKIKEKKALKVQSYSQDSSEQSVRLDCIDEEMQKLSHSQRNVPTPISEIDLRSRQKPEAKKIKIIKNAF